MNLNDAFFWAGELGLLLIVVYGAMIIDLNRERSHWLYTLCLYLTTGWALLNMGYPAYQSQPLPWNAEVFRFVLGLTFTAGYYQIKARPDMVLSEKLLRHVNWIFFIVGGVGIAVLVAVGLSLRIDRQNKQLEEIKQQQAEKADEVVQAIQADTSIRHELRQSRDSISTELETARRERELAKRERLALQRKADAIKHDTEVLKKEAKRAPDASSRPTPTTPQPDTIRHEKQRKKKFLGIPIPWTSRRAEPMPCDSIDRSGYCWHNGVCIGIYGPRNGHVGGSDRALLIRYD